MYFPVLVTYITRRLKIAATTPIVKKLSKIVTILMSATLFIISEQNIHQFITFNFESCCYPKIPQYLRLAQIQYGCNFSLVLILSNVPVYIGPYNRVAYVVCIYACLRILHQFNVLLEISVALVPCILAVMPSNIL